MSRKFELQISDAKMKQEWKCRYLGSVLKDYEKFDTEIRRRIIGEGKETLQKLRKLLRNRKASLEIKKRELDRYVIFFSPV